MLYPWQVRYQLFFFFGSKKSIKKAYHESPSGCAMFLRPCCHQQGAAGVPKNGLYKSSQSPQAPPRRVHVFSKAVSTPPTYPLRCKARGLDYLGQRFGQGVALGNSEPLIKSHIAGATPSPQPLGPTASEPVEPIFCV